MNYFNRVEERFEEAEFLQKAASKVKIKIENWDLESIEHNNLNSTSLRAKNDNTFGSNYTYGNSNKIMEKLIDGADKSIKFGKEVQFDFTSDKIDKTSLKARKAYESSNPPVIFDYIQKIINYIKSKQTDLTLDIEITKMFNRIDIRTSQGGELKDEICNFKLLIGYPVKGGGSYIAKNFESSKMFTDIFKDEIDDFIDQYNIAKEISIPKTGKLPVLFAPRSLYFLFVSLQAGFSDKINIIDKPHMEESNSRRFFDDEGILTYKRDIIKKGVLKNYLYDLEYANKLNVKSTGNGLKKELFREGISTSVSPNFINPVVETKNKSKEELLSILKDGIYVTNVIGFHSSNYEQGHFSVQAQGFNVKGGKKVGRLQDVMIAGNIYEDFQNVIDIGNKLYPNMWGYTPYILIDNVSVTGK